MCFTRAFEKGHKCYPLLGKVKDFVTTTWEEYTHTLMSSNAAFVLSVPEDVQGEEATPS